MLSKFTNAFCGSENQIRLEEKPYICQSTICNIISKFVTYILPKVHNNIPSSLVDCPIDGEYGGGDI